MLFVDAGRGYVRCGIPFRMGDVGQAAVTGAVIRDSDGRPIPTQARITATHPDGTVRWLLIHAIVPGPGRYWVAFDGDPSDRIESSPDTIEPFVAGQVREVTSTAVIEAGPVCTVTRIEATYTTAREVMYLTYVPSLNELYVSHKLIITSESDIPSYGLRIPMEGDRIMFEADDMPVTLPIDDSVAVAQLDCPSYTHKSYASTWADGIRSTARVGDAFSVGQTTIVVRDFADQAPKAVIADGLHVVIELWSDRAGRPLTFSNSDGLKHTESWLDAAGTLADVALVRAMRADPVGCSRTHDIVICHGFVAPPVVHHIDPMHLEECGLVPSAVGNDPLEDRIDEFYERHVFNAQSLFPLAGFYGWGRPPMASSPWSDRGGSIGAVPDMYRLSRGQDYLIKRGVWVAWIRSGDARYLTWARRNTRYLHDLMMSNHTSARKPLGWFVMGLWDSPISWGAFASKVFSRTLAPAGLGTGDGTACLGAASHEDLAQFVYDHFLTGDPFSRDAVTAWIVALKAVLGRLGDDLNPSLLIGADRPDAFLRLIGSAYMLDHDPELLALGEAIMTAFLDGRLRLNYAKASDTLSAVYYYHEATSSVQAQALLDAHARTYARYSFNTSPVSRHSAIVPTLLAAYGDRDVSSLVAFGQAMPPSRGKLPSPATSNVLFSHGIPHLIRRFRDAGRPVGSMLVSDYAPAHSIITTEPELLLAVCSPHPPTVLAGRISFHRTRDSTMTTPIGSTMTIHETFKSLGNDEAAWHYQLPGHISLVSFVATQPYSDYRIRIDPTIGSYRILKPASDRFLVEAQRGFPLLCDQPLYVSQAPANDASIVIKQEERSWRIEAQSDGIATDAFARTFTPARYALDAKTLDIPVFRDPAYPVVTFGSPIIDATIAPITFTAGSISASFTPDFASMDPHLYPTMRGTLLTLSNGIAIKYIRDVGQAGKYDYSGLIVTLALSDGTTHVHSMRYYFRPGQQITVNIDIDLNGRQSTLVVSIDGTPMPNIAYGVLGQPLPSSAKLAVTTLDGLSVGYRNTLKRAAGTMRFDRLSIRDPSSTNIILLRGT